VSFIHEAQVYTLKTCIIIALAALAQLYSLFAPFQPESERKYKDVIDEIANTMNMFVGKDFQYLDTTLGVRDILTAGAASCILMSVRSAGLSRSGPF
jgi:small basic protein